MLNLFTRKYMANLHQVFARSMVYVSCLSLVSDSLVDMDLSFTNTAQIGYHNCDDEPVPPKLLALMANFTQQLRAPKLLGPLFTNAQAQQERGCFISRVRLDQVASHTDGDRKLSWFSADGIKSLGAGLPHSVSEAVQKYDPVKQVVVATQFVRHADSKSGIWRTVQLTRAAVLPQFDADINGVFTQVTQSKAQRERIERAMSPVCANCGASASCKLLRCSSCRVTYYCNVACQRAHWRTVHKEICHKNAGADLATHLKRTRL
jgi:hypothetical protein